VSHNCFADEIAIDFPSAGRVVERMRDAFLGEATRGEVLAAELSLSRRQAFDGLSATLTVPIHGTCPNCGGRGESWAEPCARCAGTGRFLFHHTVRVAVPRGVTDGATFRFRVTSPHTGSVRVEVRVVIQPSLV
jgi:DnaJ-class molecular chaperone